LRASCLNFQLSKDWNPKQGCKERVWLGEEMIRIFCGIVLGVLLCLPGTAWADRGPIVWREGVELSQESQKAIILHNGSEEVLILGTEMKAKQETEILEFIPFPAEPDASLATGNPFETVSRLITQKGLTFEYYNQLSRGKGGEPSAKTEPVEIRFSEKIGLHDVTTLKINDIEQFSGWLEDYFRRKDQPVSADKLKNVVENARDYLQRGYPYFVFDSVKIQPQLKFLEPLTYRFKSEKIYFPLKTSNLIGGTGTVEMILMLPGSISDDLWEVIPTIIARGGDRKLRLSSSAKLYPEETKAIYGANDFFGRSKIYLQAIKFRGPYDFKNDFVYDIGKLVPYAYRFQEESPITAQAGLHPPLTADERRDLREAICPQPQALQISLSRPQGIQLDCWNFIPADEYEVYSALLRNHQLSGIPHGAVILEKNTERKRYEGKNIDKSVDADAQLSFNENNRTEYPLENGFPKIEGNAIKVRVEDRSSLSSNGKTYISRAGFNKARTEALIYVEHLSGPRSGVGYFVVLEKKDGSWTISRSHLGVIY
jgi:hypothetical protein